MLNLAPDWGPKAATDWSLISCLQRPRDSIAHIAPVHIVLVQMSAINERRTATGTDRSQYYRPTRGTIEFIPSHADHKAAWELPKHSAFFGFTAESLERLADREFGISSVEIVGPKLGTIDRYILNLAELMRLHFVGGGLLADLYADAISTLLAVHVLQSYSELSGRSHACSGARLRASSRRVVLELFDSRIGQGITIAELSEATGLSVSQFMRAFKAEFGMSPHRYLLDKRIDAAVEAIGSTTLPLAAIAADCGFASQSHMTAAFTRFRSITPSALRRRD
ncbi:helix-turn-helix transcriptional regulator [Agrobacterium rhizogenes]|nr:helix-turn-helix transcriptional regulator [Rhizobium rhizogenes]NTG32276.1 helix-turn-helix transcriptional regulator [Rhizobium rhizogenes]